MAHCDRLNTIKTLVVLMYLHGGKHSESRKAQFINRQSRKVR